MISLALALGDPITEKRIIVDEVVRCTRDKLKEILRSNQYDIVYFTGHGFFKEDTGFLLLESPNGSSVPISAGEFVSALKRQKNVDLVFLQLLQRRQGWGSRVFGPKRL